MNDQLIGKILAGKYRIDALLSETYYGNLYRATHLTMDKPVAVKVLSPAFAGDSAAIKRFADEARTVSRVLHPNILNVTDYGSDKSGDVFIVYDDATGETLKEIISREGQFSTQRAENIIRQAAAALSAAHTGKIVHQNLSADNILVRNSEDGTEQVKVLNFGTAADESKFDETKAFRSAEYFSPEQSANGAIDERSDVYALGVILYEMLTGEVPFTSENPQEIMQKHAEQPPPPISAFRTDLPARVDEVLLTALAKNPQMRFQTAQDFADALHSAVYSVPANSAPAVVVQKGAAQNNIWKTAFIVLAGVSLLSAFFIYTTSVKQTDPQTQLAVDADGMPVQPVNPATGTAEQDLANMSSYTPALYGNSNAAGMPGGANPDSGVYNPYWDRGTLPPGAPRSAGGSPSSGMPYPVQPGYVPQGGEQVYVDGNGSIFMPKDGNTYIMVPKNAGNTASNVNTQPTRRTSNSNTNTAAAPTNTAVKPPVTTPAANTAVQPKASPSPVKTPLPKASPTPKKSAAPSANEKRPASETSPDSD